MVEGCPEPGCESDRLIIACADRGGWLVKCNNSHELFPFPGMTIVAYEPEITSTQLTFRNK